MYFDLFQPVFDNFLGILHVLIIDIYIYIYILITHHIKNKNLTIFNLKNQTFFFENTIQKDDEDWLFKLFIPELVLYK